MQTYKCQVLATLIGVLPIFGVVWEKFNSLRNRIYMAKMRERMAGRIVKAYRFWMLRREVTG